MRERVYRRTRGIAVMVFSLVILGGFFRLTTAGSLFPASAPASSMNSIEDTYDALVGTFDSSAIASSSSGSAIQLAKCIIERVTGGNCP